MQKSTFKQFLSSRRRRLALANDVEKKDVSPGQQKQAEDDFQGQCRDQPFNMDPLERLFTISAVDRIILQ